MKKESKKPIVDSLERQFASSGTYYLVDYKRMTVAQAVQLRKILRKNGFSYKVIKNRLALRALGENCPEALRPYFQKPTAVAFAEKDAIPLAKILKDFSNQGKILAVKGGVVEGQYLAAERFDEISKLSSREDLMARFARLMAAPLVELLRTLQAPLSNLGNLLNQLKVKKQD